MTSSRPDKGSDRAVSTNQWPVGPVQKVGAGERVDAGSEPRAWDAAEMLKDFIGRTLRRKLGTAQREHALRLLADVTTELDRLRVVEQRPGTEGEPCPNPLCRDGWVPYEPNESRAAPPICCKVCHGAGRVPPESPEPEGERISYDTPKRTSSRVPPESIIHLSEWRPDPRTVAAVVEELRDMGWRVLASYIEERFKAAARDKIGGQE